MRKNIGVAVLVWITVAVMSSAHAAWPDKTVRITIPWPPGGSTDIIGRILAAELTKRTKQQFIIDNRSGAGSIIGLQHASQQPPDGYTLMMTKTHLAHVPFKGGGPAAADTMAGHTEIMLGSLPTVVAMVGSGRPKLLATGGLKRNPKYPNMPTVAETVPGYDSTIWWGMFAPRNTPADIIASVHAEISSVMTSPEMMRRLDEQGAGHSQMSSAEFGKLMVSETNEWLEVIRLAGIKAE